MPKLGYRKSNPKSLVMQIRLTPDEQKIIKDHARNDGMTVSEYLLSLVRRDQKIRILEAGVDESEL